MAIRLMLAGTMVLLMAIIVTHGQISPATQPAPKLEAGKTVDGLQIKVERAEHGEVEVTFQNVGQTPMVLNMGFMLGNGRTLIPNQLQLVITGKSGESRRLHWREPSIAGRVDDFLVPVMAGGKYSLTVPLASFIVDDGKFMPATAAGGEKIQAVYQGIASRHPSAIIALPIWTNEIESSEILYSE